MIEGERLKQFLKTNIETALELSKEPDLTIKFKFIDEKLNLNEIETFNLFGNGVRYKDVYLGEANKKETIKLMVDNLHHDRFSYIDMIEHHTPTQCHVHGEYWGEDTYTFIYKRL